MDLACIIGMHRSGTSLAARVANLLGGDLGPHEELMEARPDNPTGFWESKPVARLNEEILGMLGGSWDHPPALPPGWQDDERFDDLRRRAGALLEERFGGAGVALWKDPRASLTLPLWADLVSSVRAVVCVRDPREVARSLLRRNGIAPERTGRLWVRYVLAALRHAPDAEVILYAHFFDDLDGTAARLARALGLPAPTERALGQVRAFFDEGLRHHHPADGPVPLGLGLAIELFEGLRAGALPPATRTAVERALAEEGLLERCRDALGESEARRAALEEEAEALRVELSATVRRLEEERTLAHHQVDRSITLADEAIRAAAGLQVELARAQRTAQIAAREVEAAAADRHLLRERLDALARERDQARAEARAAVRGRGGRPLVRGSRAAE